MGRVDRRLIPARAGKTAAATGALIYIPAHPRSRGENPTAWARRPGELGSSPLARGKPLVFGDLLSNERLIPARAGKTTRGRTGGLCCRAHPRSRGENCKVQRVHLSSSGSSPLARGKLDTGTVEKGADGLIPARAGKTGRPAFFLLAAQAHPRSRGENGLLSCARAGTGGSSPLARGKPTSTRRLSVGRGLIPARAGKTT